MNDGWRMFGAGCLGAIIGFMSAVALTMRDVEDKQADRVVDGVRDVLNELSGVKHGDGH